MRSEDILRREHLLIVLNRPGERVPGETRWDVDREVRADSRSTGSMGPPFVSWAVRHKAGIRRLPIVGRWAMAAYHRRASKALSTTDGLSRGERVTRRIPIIGPVLVWCVRLVLLPQRFAKLSAAFVQLEQRLRDEQEALTARIELRDAEWSRPDDTRGESHGYFREAVSGPGGGRQLDAADRWLALELSAWLSDLLVPGAVGHGKRQFALVGYTRQDQRWFEELVHLFPVECVILSAVSIQTSGGEQGARLSPSDVAGIVEECAAGSLVGVAFDATQVMGDLGKLASVLNDAFAATQASGVVTVECRCDAAGPRRPDEGGLGGHARSSITSEEMLTLLQTAGYVDVRAVAAQGAGGAAGRQDHRESAHFTVVGRKP